VRARFGTGIEKKIDFFADKLKNYLHVLYKRQEKDQALWLSSFVVFLRYFLKARHWI